MSEIGAASGISAMDKQTAKAGEQSQSEKASSQSAKQVESAQMGLPSVHQIHSLIGNRYTGAWLQAKLAVSQPGDVYEQEADRVAEHVMRAPDAALAEPRAGASGPAVSRLQRKCAQCEDEEILQAKEAPEGITGAAPAPHETIETMRVGGQPLSESARAFFEPRFGRDFGHVRVHTDAEAAESARAINALAYTVGPDIVFGAGQYAPGSPAGQRLIAHELTHVLQQTSSTSASESGRDSDPKVSLGIQQAAPGGLIQRFSTSEHERIGETAYARAYSQIQSAPSGQAAPAMDEAFVNSLKDFRFRVSNQRTLNYGQMVAVADDVASFELLEEREQNRAGSGVRIPVLSPIWDRIGDATHYLDLAARNRAHFHPHNFLSWQPWHWHALRTMNQAWRLSEQANDKKREVRTLLDRFDNHSRQGRKAIEELDAISASSASGAERQRAAELDRVIEIETAHMQSLLRQAQESQQKYKTLRAQANDLALRAMAINGFGDHFLTDAFAAGHIVTPRRELLDEFGTRLLGVAPTGGVLHCANIPSLAWHDLDNKFGVKVNNAEGAQWVTYGDDYADEGALPGGKSLSPTMEHVVEATAISIGQMWQAAGGRMPDDLLPVLNKIPRPNLDEYPLWTPTDWDLQLRYAAGEQLGMDYDVMGTSSPSASRRRAEEAPPNPRGNTVGAGLLSARATCLNLMSQFSYQNFVAPMIERARRDYEERFFTGRAGQILSPDTKPAAQDSVVGNVVLGSLLGLGAGVGLGLLIGGLLIGGGLALALGGVIGAVAGFLIGGLAGGLSGKPRGESAS